MASKSHSGSGGGGASPALNFAALIASLQTTSRLSREQSAAADIALLKASNAAADLETKIRNISELERTLKEEKDRYVQLETKYHKLELDWFTAEAALHKYKNISDQLREQVDLGAEDIVSLRSRIKRADECIGLMQKETRRKEQELVELQVENQDYKCGKQRAQEEADHWKSKFSDAQVQAMGLFDENLALRANIAAMEKEKVWVVSKGCSDGHGHKQDTCCHI